MEEGTAETSAPVLQSTLTAPARLCLHASGAPEPEEPGEGSESKENHAPGALDTPSFSLARGSTRFNLPVSPPHSTMSTAAAGGTGSSPSSPPDPSSPKRCITPAPSSLTPPPGSPRAGAASTDAPALAASKSWVRRVQARTDELRRLFGLGPGEQLMDDYLCALKKKVLLQGRLFVFERHLCFYSSLFGYHKVKVVPLASVHDIAKKKNVGFPNSIQVLWDSGGGGLKKEFFTSFLSREDAYRLLLGLWGRCCERGRERAAAELGPAGTDDEGDGMSRGLSRRWSKWGTSKGHSAAAAAAAATSAVTATGGDAAAGSDRNSVLDEDAHSGDGTASPGDPPQTGPGATDPAAAGNGSGSGGAGEGGPSFDPLSWMGRPLTPPPPEAASVLSDGEDGGEEGSTLLGRPSFVHGSSIREFEEGPTCDEACILREFENATEPAPPRPDTMQRVLRCQLPTTPLGFYRAFLCPSSDFFIAFHESQGHHSIELAPWQRHYKVGPVRDLRFVSPLRGWRIGPSQTLCHQTQRFKVHAGQHLVFETSQVMTDIPYGDHFRVDQRWDVTPLPGGNACTLDVHIAVPFTKNTLWRKVIEKSSIDSTLEAFRMFRELADRRLAEATPPSPADEAAAVPAAPAGAANGPAEGAGMVTPVAASPVVAHRRTASRPSSPEDVLPTTAEEWEALIAHVDPQWRGGLRALKRMQMAGGAGAPATAVSPLPGGPRHRRRASRVSVSRAGSGGLEVQPHPAGMQFGSVSAAPSSQTSKLAQVPEQSAMAGALTGGGVKRRAGAFLARRGPVMLLCLLFAVIVVLQAALLALQLRRAAPLAAPLDGNGPSRLAAAREVAAIAAQLEALQRDAAAWANQHGALLRAADGLAQRIGRLQAALTG